MILLAVGGAAAPAQGVPWSHPDGTTHWYEVVSDSVGLTWAAANAAARARGGHLATLTSQAENDRVFQLVDQPLFWRSGPGGRASGPWLGGLQPDGSPEPAGNWKWSTGEPLGFSNFATGQPDNAGSENRIQFGSSGVSRAPTWNDIAHDANLVVAYLIEWSGHSPTQTVGSFQNSSGSSGGYTLFPTPSGTSVLIDGDGRVVNTWTSSVLATGFAPYLQDNGDVVSAHQIAGSSWNGISVGGTSGRIERRAWDGTLVWQHDVNTTQLLAHHDIEVLPNGNILTLAWERKTGAEAILAGRDPALLTQGELWPEAIIELQPTGPTSATVVWSWHLWDHLVQDHDPAMANFGVVAAHPELVNLNYADIGLGQADWNHANSIDYNPQLDQIVISLRNFGEIWVIDHSTTTVEAAGHTGGLAGRGGDILYRWGNPEAYDAGVAADQTLFGQHTPEWIAPGLSGAGRILVFNNGFGRPEGAWSSVEEITPPVDAMGNYILAPGAAYGPTAPDWIYTAPHPEDFSSRFVSGAQRLPNGNTLVGAGVWGEMFEVTPSGETVWRYTNPVVPGAILFQGDSVPQCNPAFTCNFIFRPYRYPASHPAFLGRNLAAGDPVELYAPEVAARFGTVNLDAGSRADVLRLNGETGDVWREVYVDSATPVTLTIDASPAGPTPSDYILYLYFGDPDVGTMETQPFGVGTSAIPMPVMNPPFISPSFTLVNTLGDPLLGQALFPGVPRAPTTVLSSLLPVGTIAVQGVILDASATSFVSVTNAIVLTVH